MNLASEGRRSRLSPETRRSQLLVCSIAVFAEHGIARATHSQVAEKAGVSVAAVYSYFRTRGDLVSATLAEVARYLREILEGTLEKGLPPFDALIDLGRAFALGAQANPDVIRVWLDWSTGVGLESWPTYLQALDQFQRAAEQILIDGKRQGVVPDCLNVKAAARICLSGGHAVALMQLTADSSSEDLEIFIDQLVRGAMGIAADAIIA